MIENSCPSCGASNEIPEAYLGQDVTCPACKDSYVAMDSAPMILEEQKRIPATRPETRSIPRNASNTSPNIIPGLIALFIAFFAFVNRDSFFSPEVPLGTTNPGAVIWEYESWRIYNSNMLDSKETEDRWVKMDDERLNSYGKNGWELVTCYLEMETDLVNLGSYDTHTGIKSNVRPQAVVVIFKRPKQAEK